MKFLRWLMFWRRPQKPAAPALVPVADTPPHRSWVVIGDVLGWLHHHEADGYVIQTVDGNLIKAAEFRHAEPHEVPVSV